MEDNLRDRLEREIDGVRRYKRMEGARQLQAMFVGGALALTGAELGRVIGWAPTGHGGEVMRILLFFAIAVYMQFRIQRTACYQARRRK